MTAKEKRVEKALDLLVHNAEDVKNLAREQRDIADAQHATAHEIDRLGSQLKREAVALQAEIRSAMAG
jgi:hypothetical protein